MQQDGELARYGHNRSLLSVLAAAHGQVYSPAFQIAVWSESSQQVLRALHQKRT